MKPRLLIVPLSLSLACIALQAVEQQPADASDEAESDYPTQGMIPDRNMLHIGIVVRDIDAAIDHWTSFLGLDAKPRIIMAEGHEDNPTEYRGHLTGAKAKLAFFKLDNMQVELIEPFGDGPSHWREFLETKGEGVHHVAFRVKGMGEQYLTNYADLGMPVIQHGGWNGGEYGYMDTIKALGVTVELIENYNR